jgi:hypothetical protein
VGDVEVEVRRTLCRAIATIGAVGMIWSLGLKTSEGGLDLFSVSLVLLVISNGLRPTEAADVPQRTGRRHRSP